MNASEIPLKTRIFNKLCAEWVAQTANPPKFLDDGPDTVGQAAINAIDGPGYVEDGLLTGPSGVWFMHGVELGVAIAAAVAADPLGNPQPVIASALHEATADLRQFHETQQEDAQLERRQQRKRRSRSSAADTATGAS